MGTCVLVAEDDKMQAELVRRYLEHEGLTALVAHDGLAALEQARRRHPDLIILDVMMPGMDGLELCRTLRRESEVPVLMLTARTSEDDLLLGLGLGADDYMTKPYSPRELMARVRTLLRRNRDGSPWGDGALHVGDLGVDPGGRRVWIGAAPVECTRGEFEILAAMAAQPDRVFSRAQLLQEIHGLDLGTTERTIDMHVMNLRKKIEADPRRPVRLVTVFGVGYKLTDGTGGRRRAP
ncbi:MULTISPECIES: response regulator transcription factor [Streptacidiphilus]|uniref:Response regulator transcription factor n=1 Tax=Streptacidiphilus cavernicola TaxID=3342716 RepID=A0ABV6UM74_9ACTN|nr:response regulator transcription factor [Streptacidiphilus jeojiense]